MLYAVQESRGKRGGGDHDFKQRGYIINRGHSMPCYFYCFPVALRNNSARTSINAEIDVHRLYKTPVQLFRSDDNIVFSRSASKVLVQRENTRHE